MKYYSRYEIRKVIERDGLVNAVSHEIGKVIAAAPFWTLYGHHPTGAVQAIGDFTTYEDVRTAYRLLTGVDCGAEPRDHFGLPNSKADPVYEARRKAIHEIAVWQIGPSEQIQLDDDADFSEGELNPYKNSANGAYVQTWYWVDFAGTPLDKDDDAAEPDSQQPDVAIDAVLNGDERTPEEIERHAAWTAYAQERYNSDTINVDDDAKVSEGDDNGAWVQAWVWVEYEVGMDIPHFDPDVDDDGEGDDDAQP